MGENIFDVIIIGAGPAGLTAAIFARRKGFSLLLVEGNKAGGQLQALYPDKPVYNYPGYTDVAAAELAGKMIGQVENEGISIMEHAPVEKFSATADGGLGVTIRGQTYRGRAVIIACGIGLFEPRRLNVPGETDLERMNLYYTVEDITDWRGRDVAVVGGGNSALDNARLLTQNGCRVALIHQFKEFQADRSSVELLDGSHTKCYLEKRVVSLQRTRNSRVAVFMRSADGQSEEKIEVERILVNIGQKYNYGFLQNSGVKTEKNRVMVDSEMKTTLQGVFACGDTVTYPGKIRLIVTAVGEAATAVNSLETYLKKTEETPHA